MTKATTILLIIAGAVVGFLAGYAVPVLQERGEKDALTSPLATKYPDLDMKGCIKFPASQVQPCIDGLLAGHAATRASQAICSDIQNASLRQNCVNQVGFAQRFGGDTSKFCQGLSDDPLCRDLASILLAKTGRDRDLCFGIASQELRSVCTSLIAPPEQAKPAATAPDTSALLAPQYGLICNSADKACLDSIPAFNAAISAKSEQQCNGLGVYADRCLNELAFYRSYVANDASLCVTRHPEAVCKLQLTIAQALDGKPELCNALEEAQRDVCKIEVQAAKGMKRFGYLIK